ncbi:MAG: hypothetical protein FH749_07745 [Firmicutes bacterium]|nr:hypothetical protein [Bacillota bacterium]
MLNFFALVVAAVTVFWFDRAEKGGFSDNLLYFVLGIVPLRFAGWLLPLGLPTALMLILARAQNKKQKLAFVLVGALVGWYVFTYLRPPGA